VRLAVLVVVVGLAAFAATSASSAGGEFRGHIAPIDAALAKRMTGVSWRPGCPVALRDLRLLTLTHWGFDGRARTGRLIVHREVAREVVVAFRELYAAHASRSGACS
jgi:hypothetical protein